jgi:hydroxypyruvate isomerase
VHIADVPGRHEPGTGEINYTNIYRSLGKLRYNRFIGMEYAPTTDPVASLRKSRMEAQQSMASSA